jgi:hypothetical protein
MNRKGTTLVGLLLAVAGAVAACTGSSTPPGANKYLGTFEGGGYLFLRWEEGLEVMLWHDMTGSAAAQSAGSTDDRVTIELGSARSADGRSLEWELRTTDGKRGELQIGGATYEVAGGSVFLVTTRGGTTEVRQLDRDLSSVPLSQEGILAFAENDPDLAAFISSSGSN